MLVDTLTDRSMYFKATLVSALKEAKQRTGLPIACSYKSILRREEDKVPLYLEAKRDPVNEWRMYSGSLIKRIVSYELKRRAR